MDICNGEKVSRIKLFRNFAAIASCETACENSATAHTANR